MNQNINRKAKNHSINEREILLYTSRMFLTNMYAITQVQAQTEEMRTLLKDSKL